MEAEFFNVKVVEERFCVEAVEEVFVMAELFAEAGQVGFVVGALLEERWKSLSRFDVG